MTTQPQPDVLTTREAAARLGLSVTSVQKMVQCGALQAWVTPGGHRRISSAAVEQLRQDREQSGDVAYRTPTERMRVLLAEDDEVQVRYFRTLIDRCDYPVDLTVAPDASVALIQLERQRPDLIVTDLLMQPFDGFHLIKMLEQDPAYYAIDLMVLSAMDRVEAQKLGKLPDWVTFYQKPVSPERLIGYLDSMHTRVIKAHIAANKVR
ncbi:MAG: response regulator [Pseudomonadota bacterium]